MRIPTMTSDVPALFTDVPAYAIYALATMVLYHLCVNPIKDRQLVSPLSSARILV